MILATEVGEEELANNPLGNAAHVNQMHTYPESRL